jgi:hypothetical protein
MTADPEALTLRPTLIGGETAPDDYQVIWDSLPIGRILKQPGVPVGGPTGIGAWLSRVGRHRGNCSDLDECQRRFKAVWAGIRAGLSAPDIEAARRVESDADWRFKKWQ